MTPLSILFPLVFVVFCGFICAKTRFISSSQLDGLRHYIFNFSIPVFLFISMYQADLNKSLSISVFIGFYLPVVVLYVVCVCAYFLINKSIKSSAILALASTYSNTVLVGLPMIISGLGAEYAALVFMIITFHSAVLFVLTYLLCASFRKNPILVVKPLLQNPVVLSIGSGLLANYLQLPIHSTLQTGIRFLSEPAIAGALFVLGASLTNYSVKDAWKKAFLISLIKLVVLPLLVYTTARYVLFLPTDHTIVITLMSASPLGLNAYLIARQLNVEQATLASSVVLSTLLSTVTLSGWLILLIP